MAIYDPVSGRYYNSEEEMRTAALVRQAQERENFQRGGPGIMDAISSGWNWLTGGGLAETTRKPIPPPESSEEAYRRFRMNAYGNPEGPYGGPEPIGPREAPSPIPPMAQTPPFYSPPGVPPQNFSQGDPAAQWRQFVEAGGKEMKYGNGTTIKYKKPESPEEKARRQQVKAQVGASPQPGGAPQGRAISGPFPMETEQVGPRPGDVGPGQAPPQEPPPTPPQGPGDYPARDVDRRAQAAALQYKSRFAPGNEPMNAAEWERRKRALIEQKASEQERLLQESMPEKGVLLARAYERINRSTGKGTRILLGILSGNPFWADGIAAMEAEYEAKRAAVIGKERRDISANKYTELMDLVDGLDKRQGEHKKVVAAELTQRIQEEPNLIYSRDASKDYALLLGVPTDQVEQFLDDHFDEKTGVFNLLKDPYEENIIRAKNDANVILELYPWIPKEMALLVTKHPNLLLELSTDEAKLYEVKAMHEKDPEKKAEYQRISDLLRSRATTLAQSEPMRRLIMLQNIHDNKTVWNKMTEKEQTEWYVTYQDAHKAAFGPATGRDPKSLYRKERQEEEELKGRILTNRHVAIQNKLLLTEKPGKEEKDQSNVYTSIAVKTYPILSQKKASALNLAEADRDQQITIAMMAENQIPTGQTPIEKDIRRKADIIKLEVWKYFPLELQKQLGNLSYLEAAVVLSAIYGAQVNEPRQTPNMAEIAEYLRQSREGQKKIKTK